DTRRLDQVQKLPIRPPQPPANARNTASSGLARPLLPVQNTHIKVASSTTRKRPPGKRDWTKASCQATGGRLFCFSGARPNRMKKVRLVMLGNGVAGVRTLEELLRLGPALYEITVFGVEPPPHYNRILLSPVPPGAQTVEEIVLNDLNWYAERNIRLLLGRTVVHIDRTRRRVIASDGTEAEYDRLLLATGSTPFILPVPGKELEGVIGYRDIADTRVMLDTARTHRHAVVIGGGLLGLEAANGLTLRGMTVTVVHLGEWLLDRQLDRTAGRLLQQALEARGIRFRLQAQTQALLDNGRGRVGAVQFSDGEQIPADLVVMAAGIRPNAELAERAGLPCERGVLVSDTLQTFDPRIYAVGECANHRGTAYGLVAPLCEQAQVCASHLPCMGVASYPGSVSRPSSRSPASTCFPQAISWARQAPRASSSPTRSTAATRN